MFSTISVDGQDFILFQLIIRGGLGMDVNKRCSCMTSVTRCWSPAWNASTVLSDCGCICDDQTMADDILWETGCHLQWAILSFGVGILSSADSPGGK